MFYIYYLRIVSYVFGLLPALDEHVLGFKEKLWTEREIYSNLVSECDSLELIIALCVLPCKNQENIHNFIQIIP